MKYKGNMKSQRCTHDMCNAMAVVGQREPYYEALCLEHLSKLRTSGWDSVYTCQLEGTLLDAVLECIKEMYPDCLGETAPDAVGCNIIVYDAEGVIAGGNRVTLGQLEAMVERVKSLKAESSDKKERVWWSQIGTKHNTTNHGVLDKTAKFDTLRAWEASKGGRRNIYENYPWKPVPVDANGQPIDVLWECRSRKNGMLYSVPVRADKTDVELDLCLGGADWEYYL